MPPEAITLLYVGGMGDLNHIAEAIRAISEVPRVHVILTGWVTPEYRAGLERLARDRNCLERIHFIGEIASDKWESSPEQIASARSRLVESNALRSQMHQSCLALHQREFQFEHQFLTLLKRDQEYFTDLAAGEKKLKNIS